ncbi:hypothetical protein WJX72_011376 [[Myrmecia] bisecta]|uniref:J domain-containing protein n=1 Tax=[Myrmecia] bisecta TaxID=41462 RepID=A0AAW1PFI1_9CHLO
MQRLSTLWRRGQLLLQGRHSPTGGMLSCCGLPCLRILSEELSTLRGAAGASSEGGPPESKVRAIPFRHTREEAVAAFEAYHSRNLFLVKPWGGLQKVKEAFLPFWVASARVSVFLKSAYLGFERTGFRYNPATRRTEPYTRTEWHTVIVNQRWQRQVGPDTEGTQIYASHKYPRSEINYMRPGPHVAAAQAFEPPMLEAPDGSTRRVGPFTMKPAVAQRFARDFLTSQEHKTANEFLRSSTGASQVGAMDIDVDIFSLSAAPVYVPVFVFSSLHLGAKVRTFVSGVDTSRISGTRIYDESIMAGAAGLAATAGVLAFGLAPPFTTGVVLGWMVAPAIVAGLLAHYYPRLRAEFNRQRQEREQSRFEAAAEDPWDAEWIHAYSRYEEYQRFQDEQESYSYASQAGGRIDHDDPRGYYKALGVDPKCTKQEIQASYRAHVMKQHPDRFPEPAAKAEATKRLQKLNEAYSVLRDPTKRRQYDAGA